MVIVEKVFHNKEFRLQMDISEIGSDLLVVITGGEAHIGGISLAQYHENENKKGSFTTTQSTLCVYGHKEGTISNFVSEALSKKTEKNVVAVVGMHWNGITQDEIECVNELLNQLIEKF